MQPDGVAMLRFGTNYGPLTASGEWWRLFTAMFLHFGLVHLLLNMWALLSLGMLTERLYGSARFAMLYLFAGLVGSLASYYWHPNLNSAGASGAIFGVIGALLAFMLNPRTRIPPTVAAAQRNSALVFIAYNLANGFAHQGIDNAAHLGGLTGGFVIGWLLARPLTREAREDSAHAGALVGLGALALLVIGAWPVIHPSSAQRADLAFRQQLGPYAEAETKAVDAQRALVARGQNHEVGERKLAEQMLYSVVPRWTEAQSIVQRTLLPNDSKLAPLRSALLHYLDLNIRLLTVSAQIGLGTATIDKDAFDSLKAQRDAAFAQAGALMNSIN
jgi:rhomboid protease GluP